MLKRGIESELEREIVNGTLVVVLSIDEAWVGV